MRKGWKIHSRAARTEIPQLGHPANLHFPPTALEHHLELLTSYKVERARKSESALKVITSLDRKPLVRVYGEYNKSRSAFYSWNESSGELNHPLSSSLAGIDAIVKQYLVPTVIRQRVYDTLYWSVYLPPFYSPDHYELITPF